MVEIILKIQREQGLLDEFLKKHCEEGEYFEAYSTDLYNTFVAWFQKNINSDTRFTPSHKKFGTLIGRKFERLPDTTKIKYYGVKLKG
jgi:phage/plasmid-associated DNA primase